jgi:hypothetical protein
MSKEPSAKREEMFGVCGFLERFKKKRPPGLEGQAYPCRGLGGQAHRVAGQPEWLRYDIPVTTILAYHA